MLCFLLNLRTVFKHKPPGFFIFQRGVFCFTSSGGLFSEFYGITVSHISSPHSASRKSRLNNSQSGKKIKFCYKQNGIFFSFFKTNLISDSLISLRAAMLLLTSSRSLIPRASRLLRFSMNWKISSISPLACQNKQKLIFTHINYLF